MLLDDRIFLGVSTKPEYLLLKYGNRHGLVTGATGTGKTVTLQGLAEGFSRAGVPVFLADVKGDLAGLAAMGEQKDFLVARAKQIGFDDWQNDKFPAIFWDLFGKQGHPVRATISEMGPLLLSRILDLNDTQEGALLLPPASSFADVGPARPRSPRIGRSSARSNTGSHGQRDTPDDRRRIAVSTS